MSYFSKYLKKEYWYNLTFMRLILVRHGETLENRRKITQGQLNTQLTSEGTKQAKKVAQRLKDEYIDIAFSSDLDRALDTCYEILKFHNNTQLFKTKTLREWTKGVFEGKSSIEKDKSMKNSTTSFYKWSPKGGESLTDVWKRVISFLEKIKKEYPNKTVLISTHGKPIRCIISHLQNKTIETINEHNVKNTAISIININDNKVEFEVLNCTEHL